MAHHATVQSVRATRWWNNEGFHGVLPWCALKSGRYGVSILLSFCYIAANDNSFRGELGRVKPDRGAVVAAHIELIDLINNKLPQWGRLLNARSSEKRWWYCASRRCGYLSSLWWREGCFSPPLTAQPIASSRLHNREIWHCDFLTPAFLPHQSSKSSRVIIRIASKNMAEGARSSAGVHRGLAMK